MALAPPHGKEHTLKPRRLVGDEAKNEAAKAAKLPKVPMTSREASDAIMMGMGAFTPLDGFMGHDDWKSVCTEMKTTDGTFWPIPITLSAGDEVASGLSAGTEVALWDEENDALIGTMVVQEKYEIDKSLECRSVFTTEDLDHPGVKKVHEQAKFNLAGPVKTFSESFYRDAFGDLLMSPEQSRKTFEEKGWHAVAALQLRNPMHRSHEYLAKIAVEVCDGLFIHQLLGKLKPGDIPAEVRVNCINTLVDKYFVDNTVVTGGYPMEMRYAGPREALLHAVFRQNFGCSHLIVGRDHAGVGNYYGPFDAQHIFREVPEGALAIKPLCIDWTFFCYKCGGMASMKTCPHGKDDRLLLSGTLLRKKLSEGEEVPAEFSRPEVLEILGGYYSKLDKKVTIDLHRGALGPEGEAKKD